MAENPEQIAPKLRQVDVLHEQGATNTEAARQFGVTQQTFYPVRMLYDWLSSVATLKTVNTRIPKCNIS